ncbi:MAG: ComF family protein [Pseudomonadota bacterium]
MKQIINNWLKNSHLLNLESIFSLFFKQHCFLCVANQTEKYGVCQDCLKDLTWSPASSCPQCALNSNSQICGNCISSQPDFDVTHAVFLYAYPVDTIIQRYKYGGVLSLSGTFGQLMSEKIRTANNCDAIDLIVPMPMHPTRLKERGFNQALEIAKELDLSLNKNNISKLDYKSVIRHTLTPPQASLPLKDRVKNIKGAFKVNKDLTGKRIAIVDDVMTTGASLNELAKTLKQAGATHVECWVIARTFPH